MKSAVSEDQYLDLPQHRKASIRMSDHIIDLIAIFPCRLTSFGIIWRLFQATVVYSTTVSTGRSYSRAYLSTNTSQRDSEYELLKLWHVDYCRSFALQIATSCPGTAISAVLVSITPEDLDIARLF